MGSRLHDGICELIYGQYECYKYSWLALGWTGHCKVTMTSSGAALYLLSHGPQGLYQNEPCAVCILHLESLILLH